MNDNDRNKERTVNLKIQREEMSTEELAERAANIAYLEENDDGEMTDEELSERVACL